MPTKKHHIKLDSDEREHLESLTRKQKVSAVKARRARAMLAMDCGLLGPALSDSKASRISGLSVSSLERLRERVCETGALGALERKPRLTPPVEPIVTGEVEARMVQIACSAPPEGRSRWTMRMIAERLIELEVVATISDETVRMTLKKTSSSRGSRNAGASRRKRTRPS
jgi:hypothetical protein